MHTHYNSCYIDTLIETYRNQSVGGTYAVHNTAQASISIIAGGRTACMHVTGAQSPLLLM